MSPATAAEALLCWNCRQPLPPGTQRCLYCGVPQEARSAALVVAPYALPGAPSSATVAAPAGAPAASGPGPLGESFLGGPAGVGIRLAAFTIDVAVVAAVGVAVALLLRSPIITAVAVVEVIVGLVVLQARTGLGPGNALLRIRVARADRPYSPGVGRSAIRGLVTAAGALVGGLGAWFVELTAAFDQSGRRRSWGDLAARTVVVAVPRPTPGVPATRPVPRSIAPAVTPSAPPAAPPQAAPPPVAPPPAVPIVAPLPPPAAPGPLVPLPEEVERTEVAGGLVAAAGRPEQDELDDAPGEALLSFDTGQRERLPIPSIAVLGRNPNALDTTDVVIVVRDPESTVSKNHVRLELTRAGTWATDTGSTNGTDLLDEDGSATSLTPGLRTPVEDGTRVRLGNRVVTISTLVGGAA